MCSLQRIINYWLPAQPGTEGAVCGLATNEKEIRIGIAYSQVGDSLWLNWIHATDSGCFPNDLEKQWTACIIFISFDSYCRIQKLHWLGKPSSWDCKSAGQFLGGIAFSWWIL